MADRGTVIAYDADEVVLEPDGYLHVMEPTAAFDDQYTGIYFGPW